MGLSDTSALVLLWADGAVHTSRDARAYLGSLDLEAGMGILGRCNRVWAHYGEVIKNRKHCVLEASRRMLRDRGIGQMVILGAGFDALSVEMLHGEGGLEVYEADSANMPLKERLVRDACPGPARHIHCVDADLGDPAGLAGALEGRGWDARSPSLVVMEGVSYYLGAGEMSGLLRAFGRGGRNRAVLEYLLPGRCVSGDRARIPDGVFGAIGDAYGVPPARYDRGGIARLLGPGGAVDAVYGMGEMELARTGGNAHFGGAGSWWIEVCVARI